MILQSFILWGDLTGLYPPMFLKCGLIFADCTQGELKRKQNRGRVSHNSSFTTGYQSDYIIIQLSHFLDQGGTTKLRRILLLQ